MIREFNAIPTENGYSIYFSTVGQNSKEYSQRIEISEGELIVDNCTCPFGSVFRFSKDNQEKDKKCRHLLECLELLKYLKYIKNGTKEISDT